MVGLVIWVINFTIQKLQKQCYSGAFRNRRHARKTFDRDLHASMVIQSVAIAAKTNQIRNVKTLSSGDARTKFPLLADCADLADSAQLLKVDAHSSPKSTTLDPVPRTNTVEERILQPCSQHQPPRIGTVPD